MFMGAMVFEIVGGSSGPPSFVKGVGTKRLGKGKVNKELGENKNFRNLKPGSRDMTIFSIEVRTY